jgi:hypothetical protein
MPSKLQGNQQPSASLPSSRRQLGIIILGNTGVGKSFLANILLGQEAFVHEAAPRAVTTETEFQEIEMGNETYAVFNIPGLIEADQKRMDMNKIEIDKAFRERPTSLIVYVFGAQGGRIRDEDVVAFNALNKAYPFKLESLVIVVNGVPKDRPKNYEGEVTVLLEKLIKVSCKTLCVLGTINKSNPDQRQELKNKLLQVIVERTPQFHKKEQEIELQRDEVRKAKEQIKALQADFQQNKEMYDEKIKEQQKVYDIMFGTIRNENEQMRHLIRQQSKEIGEFNNRMVAQEAAHKKKEEQEQEAADKKKDEEQDAKNRKDISKSQRQYKKEEEQEAADKKKDEEQYGKNRKDISKSQRQYKKEEEQEAADKKKDEEQEAADKKKDEEQDAKHRKDISKSQRQYKKEEEQEAACKKKEEEEEEQEAAHKKKDEEQDAKHRKDISKSKSQRQYKKTTEEAEQASKLIRCMPHILH